MTMYRGSSDSLGSRYELQRGVWSGNFPNDQIPDDFNNSQLYGHSLQRLCAHTRNSLQSLQKAMKNSDPCWEYGLKHWHPGSRPASAKSHHEIDPLQSKAAWQDIDVMFTSAEPFEALGRGTPAASEDGSYIEATVPVNKFCYLCTTMEEHERHLLQNRKPQKYRGRQWVDFIAPRPRVRQKSDTDPYDGINMKERLYKIEVWTGDKPNAGTIANVHVIIKGTGGLLPKTKLSKSHGSAQFCFVRGSREIFRVRGPNLGNLEMMSVEHDGIEQKHSWFLEKIEVTDMKTLLTWVFMCGRWLSLHIRDYRIQRDLVAELKKLPLVEYRILVFTGKKHLSGTNSNVFITMYGSERNSKRIHLQDRTRSNKNLFEKGNMDTFVFKVSDVGKLRKIRVEHDGKGFANGWFLDRVVIHPVDNPRDKLYFLYNGWIARDIGDGKLWREIKARKNVPTEITIGVKINYHIEVHTGDEKYAGTDANVFIKMCGQKGTTKKIGLDDEKNNFERNMWDRFDRECVDVGPLDKVIIGHDNFGPGAGWYLDKVKVTRYIPKGEIIEHLKKIQKEEDKDDIKKRRQEEQDLENIDEKLTNSARSNKDSQSERSRKGQKKGQMKQYNNKDFESGSETETETDSETDSDESDVDFYDVQKHRKRIRRELSKMKLKEDEEKVGSQRRMRGAKSKEKSKEAEVNIEKMLEQGYRVPLYEEYVFECQKWFAANEGDGLFVRELPVSDKNTFYRD